MPSPRAQRQAARWLRHRGALTDLVAQLPESAAGFRPWSEAMTTAALIAHVARATDRYCSAVSAGAMPPRPATPPPVPETIAAARELLAECTARDTGVLQGLEDDQLRAQLSFGPREMPAFALLGMAVDHEIHHKGQLWTYARMCGVAPPAFVKREA